MSMRFPVLIFTKKHRTKDQLITPYSKVALKITPKGKVPVAKYKRVIVRTLRNPDILNINSIVSNQVTRMNPIYLAIESIFKQ